MQIFVTKYIKNGQQSWVWKNVRGGNVSAPFDLKFSKSGGNKTNTKLITILYWETLFFVGGCVLLGVDGRVK